jgi:Histidine kinase
MSPDSHTAALNTPWFVRLQGPLSQIAGILAAIFTGQTFSVVLRTHNWGATGRPGWVDHSGLIGLALALGLCLVSVATCFWQTWWTGQVTAMRRDRYRAWYTRSALIFIPVGSLCVPMGHWLTRVLHMPESALMVVFLGTIATASISNMGGYHRLEALARIQRDLLVQSQLAPHFLFNSLSTLKGQIAEEPGEAQVTADRLSRLFRELMDMGSQSSVPLFRELAFVEAYLGLEQARLGQRLQVSIEVPAELEDFPVPPLSLQVLVENAVRHAIAPRVEGGVLSICACRVPAGLKLVVGDPGTGQSADPGTGRGLQVLRSRLARPSDLAFEALPEGHRATLILRDA